MVNCSQIVWTYLWFHRNDFKELQSTIWHKKTWVVRTQVVQMFNVSTRIQNIYQKDAMQRGHMLHIFQIWNCLSSVHIFYQNQSFNVKPSLSLGIRHLEQICTVICTYRVIFLTGPTLKITSFFSVSKMLRNFELVPPKISKCQLVPP